MKIWFHHCHSWFPRAFLKKTWISNPHTWRWSHWLEWFPQHCLKPNHQTKTRSLAIGAVLRGVWESAARTRSQSSTTPSSSVSSPLIVRSVMTINDNGSILTKIIPEAFPFWVNNVHSFPWAKSAAMIWVTWYRYYRIWACQISRY